MLIIQMSFIRHGLFCAKSENKKRCNLSEIIRVHSQIRIKLGVVKIIMMSLLNAMLYDHDHRDHACNQDDRHQTLGKKWENKRVWHRPGFHLGPRLGHLVLLWTPVSYSYRQHQWRQWGQRLGFKALPPFHFWRFAWTRSQLTAQSGTSRRHCMPMKMHNGEKSHFGIGQPVLRRSFSFEDWLGLRVSSTLFCADCHTTITTCRVQTHRCMPPLCRPN